VTITPAHLQSLVAVQAAQLLVVHDDALAAQKDMQAAITESPA